MNTNYTLPEILSAVNGNLEKRIKQRLDDLTKPRGSLGRLEYFALRYCLCRNNASAKISKPQLFTLAADHGVTARKITPYPKEVTYQMVMNMLSGGAAVSVMCRNAGIWYSVIDAGVDGEFSDHPLLIKKKIKRGTGDFSTGFAMSDQECCAALEQGIELGKHCGSDLLGVGEMGIGNSASAAALYSLLLGRDSDETTGAGTGSTGDLLKWKKKVVREGVKLHRKEWDGTVFDAIRRCGGFEIAMMTGMIIGASSSRIPVVVDGYISGVAALCAMKMNKNIEEYLFFSHVSSENFHRKFIDSIHVKPFLDLEMRLGEGTGAVLAIQILMQALSCYNDMATFSSASVSRDEE